VSFVILLNLVLRRTQHMISVQSRCEVFNSVAHLIRNEYTQYKYYNLITICSMYNNRQSARGECKYFRIHSQIPNRFLFSRQCLYFCCFWPITGPTGRKSNSVGGGVMPLHLHVGGAAAVDSVIRILSAAEVSPWGI